MLEVLAEPAPKSSFLEHPDISESAEDVIAVLASIRAGKVPEIDPEFLSEFERTGVLALVPRRHFKTIQVLDSYRKELLDENCPESETEALASRLARVDLYPSYRHDYTNFGDQRVALTRVGKELLAFSRKNLTRSPHFIELWESFTTQEATLFKRSGTPNVINDFSGIQRDLRDAFSESKYDALAPANLDVLYPNLVFAASRLDIMLSNLTYHPKTYGYHSKPDPVITDKLTKLLRVVSALAVRVRPYVIDPDDGSEHAQTDVPSTLVQKQVMASRRLFARETGILLGTAAAKA